MNFKSYQKLSKMTQQINKKLYTVFFICITLVDILNIVYYIEDRHIYEMCFVLIMFELVLAIILYFKRPLLDRTEQSKKTYILMFFLSSIFLFIHTWATYSSKKGNNYTTIYFMNTSLYIFSLLFSVLLYYLSEEQNPYILDSESTGYIYTRV
jgi:drug/metabolite transporter (DMT)-like permease